MEDLLVDRRCGLVRHHLRTLYTDPITRSVQWGLVLNAGTILGIYSTSDLEPIRRVEGVKTYRDWKFVAEVAGATPAAASAASAVTAVNR